MYNIATLILVQQQLSERGSSRFPSPQETAIGRTTILDCPGRIELPFPYNHPPRPDQLLLENLVCGWILKLSS